MMALKTPKVVLEVTLGSETAYRCTPGMSSVTPSKFVFEHVDLVVPSRRELRERYWCSARRWPRPRSSRWRRVDPVAVASHGGLEILSDEDNDLDADAAIAAAVVSRSGRP